MNINTRTRFRTLRASAYFAASLALPLVTPALASAQQACGETTCPKGFECEEEALGCPEIDCADEPCKPCTPRTRQVCRAAACDVDDDCASGMVCAAFTQNDCSASAPDCREGGACSDVPIDAETCTSKTIKECVPRWVLACETAADCGEGFTCEATMSTRCSGSGAGSSGTDPAAPTPAGTGGSASSGAEKARPSPTAGTSGALPPDCVSEPTGRNYCKAIETACSSDANCPSGFSCQDNPNGTCWGDSSGATGCTPADPPKLCRPPYHDLGGFAADAELGRGSADGAPTSGANPESATRVSASGGGCALNGGGANGALSGGVVLLGLAFGIGRRRKHL